MTYQALHHRVSRRQLLRLAGAASAAAAAAPLLGGLARVHATPAAQEITTIEVWNDKPTWEPWFKQMGEAAAPQIGVNVKPVNYPDTASYQAAVKSALSSAQAPDLFTWWSGSWMADLAATGLLEDLSPIWKKYIDAGEVNPGLAAPYTFDGKILGVPTANAYYVGFYNIGVFNQLNLKPPTTWDELMAVCQTLKDNGVTPFGVTVQDKWPSFIWFQQILIGSDPQLYKDLMAGKVKYTDDRVVSLMNIWKGMIEKGYFSDPTIPGVGTTGQSQLAALFRQGKIGMILWGDWYIPFLRADDFKSGEHFGVYPFPKVNPQAPNAIIFETGPFALANHSGHKEAALKFVDWWMSVPAQTQWIKLYPGIPTNTKVDPGDPLLQQEMAFVKEGNYELLTRFWEATPTEIVLQAVEQLDRFMLEPGSLSEVLAAIQQTADNYWKDHPQA